MVSELQKDDPNNLYDRLTQIKAPIFLAFGDRSRSFQAPPSTG
jgi:homoserine O-acetyltransferase